MIILENVYKKRFNKTILNNITLTISDGILGILGPNGAGKTTLLEIIAKINKPTSGDIYYQGYEKKNKHTIGYLPQSFLSFEQLTCKEALVLYASLKKLTLTNDNVEEVLNKVNLRSEKNKKIKNLSGGMLRRLGIAQALLGNPNTLVLDEPTAGLDIVERIRFRKIIKSIAQERSIIISSHIVEDLESVCDKFAIMDKGTIVGTGTKKDILLKNNTKIQRLEIASEKLLSFCNEYNVTSFIPINESKYEVRVVSELKINDSVETEPNLEESYLKVLSGV